MNNKPSTEKTVTSKFEDYLASKLTKEFHQNAHKQTTKESW